MTQTSVTAWLKNAVHQAFAALQRVVPGKHSQQRAPYARVPKSHRMILAAVYAGIVVLVVGLLWRLGSQMHTRSLPKGAVTIQVDHSQYLVGEPVLFTVRNGYNAPMYVTNHCPYEPMDVYRWEADKWVQVHDQIDAAACAHADAQIRVAPSSSMTGSFGPWKNLFAQPGKYRLVLMVNYYDTLPYTDFEVIAKPVVPAIPSLNAPQSGGQSMVTSMGADDDAPNRTATPNPAPSPTPGPSSTLQTKTITISAGTIVADYSSTTIYLKSVTPSSGTYETNRTQGSTIEVTFKRPGGEVEVKLRLTNGTLTYSIED